MRVVRVEVCWVLMLLVSASASHQDYQMSKDTCNTEQVTKVSRRFSLSLYNTASRLLGQKRNLLLSPLAVGALLAMISHGASGRTKNEIYKVLKQGDRPNVVAAGTPDHCILTAYNADRFNSHFVLKDNPQRNTARLRSATRIFGDTNLTFDGDFVRDTGLYGTEMAVVPILLAPRQAERRINNWVYEQTNGNIRQIVRPRSLQTYVKMATTCSVFFKGTWMSPFLNASRGRFYLFNRRKRSTYFMTSQMPVRRISSKAIRADIVEIPYDNPDGSNIDPSLILIMPFEGTTIRTVEIGLSDEMIQKFLYGNESEKVQIRIPKFQFVGPQKLKFFLKRMGIRDIFIPRKSKLRNTLARGKQYDDKVYVSLTEHKMRFEVDEYGTQGYVYQTADDAMKADDFPKQDILNFNRPFIFMLYDKFTNTIVYLGRMSDPNRRL